MGLFDIFKRKSETRSDSNTKRNTASGTIKSTPKLDGHLSLAIASLRYYEQCISQNSPINYQVLGFESASNVVRLLTGLTESISPASKGCYDQDVLSEKSRVLSIAPDELYNAYDVVAGPLFYLTVCAKDVKEIPSGSSAADVVYEACQQYRAIAQPLDDMTSMNGIGSLDAYINMRNQGYAWVAAAVAQVKQGSESEHQLTYDDYMNRALGEVEQTMRQHGGLA